MENMPYVIAKCAMSLDGYLDDISRERLILSDEADFERVDEERSKCDAILLGAEAVRKDNPRLTIRSEERRKERIENGLPEDLIKVTITSSGNLSEDLKFFTYGNLQKIVYCSPESYDELKSRIGEHADVVVAPSNIVEPEFVLEDLYKKGIKKLMIEGGGKTLTLFLGKGLVDEIQVSIAPFFVGENNAPKFVYEYKFPHDKNRRMRVSNVEKIGDMAMITYKLNKLGNSLEKAHSRHM